MLFTSIILLTCVFYSSADHNDIHTIQYTTETFSVEVPKRNHFVMFFAPWCGHCNRLAPTWEQLAETFNNDVDSEVTIAKVDCTTDTSLCSDQDVTGYPTLKFFKAGETESVKFRGTRDMASLTVFINEQLGKTQQDSKHEPSAPEPVNGLVELTEETFTKHVASGKHFVKFYAPWCGHCQKLAPTWDALAKSFEHDTTVTIGKVDCTVHRSICNNFDIKGYPTLLWIEDGKKVEKYQGQRTHEELKAFIVQMLGSSDAEKVENMPEENTTPVIVFSGDNFDHGVSKGVSFIKFFAPWCGHCKRLAPTWEELGKKFLGNPNVKIVKVDCTMDTSKDLCNQQEVDGFPTLFLYKEGKKIAEYTGTRSLDDMYDFVMKYTQHDEL